MLDIFCTTYFEGDWKSFLTYVMLWLLLYRLRVLLAPRPNRRRSVDRGGLRPRVLRRVVHLLFLQLGLRGLRRPRLGGVAQDLVEDPVGVWCEDGARHHGVVR